MNKADPIVGALEAAEQAHLGPGPVQMVNLLRYRAQADYGGQRQFAPCAGREAYLQRYVPAFAQVAQQVGAAFKVVWLGSVQAALVGEAWHDVAIVEYTTLADLRQVLSSPEYKALAAPHHQAALERWGFLATTKVDLPA